MVFPDSLTLSSDELAIHPIVAQQSNCPSTVKVITDIPSRRVLNDRSMGVVKCFLMFKKVAKEISL